MAIEFYCPGCGKLVRTPKETAGRKGRCPICQVKIQIPNASLTSAEAPATATVYLQPQEIIKALRAPTTVQFPCERCQNPLTVPASYAGKKGKCPQCGAVMVIPTASHFDSSPAAGPAPVQPHTATAARKSSPGIPQARPAASANIQFPCPRCQQQVKIDLAEAGQQAQCPFCRAIIDVPSPAAQPTSSIQPRAPLQPRAATQPSTTPQPLNPSSDTALFGYGPPAPPGQQGLAPPASDPFTPSPFAPGLTPLPPTGIPGPSPFSAAPSGVITNPYISPRISAAAAAAAAAAAQHTRKPSRNGLPWDRELDSGFGDTVSLVLFSTREAFYKMHRSGGLGRPMLFCASGNVLAVLCSIFYYVLAQLGVFLWNFAGSEHEEVDLGPIVVRLFLAGVLALIIVLTTTLVSTVIASFVQAGMLHLCLMMVGGARQPFETTYRVWCYAIGSSSLCAVIPIVGGVISIGYQLVCLIIGCWSAHETTLGRAVGAVLINLVIACGIVVGMSLLLAGTIAQLLRMGQVEMLVG